MGGRKQERIQVWLPPGVRTIDPVTGRPYVDGAWVTITTYVRRRIKAGDLVTTAPKAAPKSRRRPSPGDVVTTSESGGDS